ncbi:MAG TPA: YebC/PmpR family DNA-binding transcriptional regulator, partial [Opitutae bacterium]|nr:YebC/PmpR family DNA-binding transcriptional regulator [Opitutae bacterium]
LHLIEKLDDLEDVKAVHSNMDIAADLLGDDDA